MDGERGHKVSIDPTFFNKLAIVKEITIFEGLSWFTRNRIARLVELVEVHKGVVICRQGDPADAFYAIVQGRVSSCHVDSRGHRNNVTFLLRGMHFGVISTLTGENHSHTYQAVNDSLILKINKDDFAELLQVTPKLALALSRSLSQRIRGRSTEQRDARENVLIAVYAPVRASWSAVYAANLAFCLKAQAPERKVLRLRFSADPHSTLPDLSGIISSHEESLHAVHKSKDSIDVLGVRFDPKDQNVISRIGQFAGWFVKDYEYVVFDLSGEMDAAVLKLLTQSDVVHLAVRGADEELDFARRTIETLSLELKDHFRPDKVQVIIGDAVKGVLLRAEDIRQILNYDRFVILPYLSPGSLHQDVVYDGFSLSRVDPDIAYALVLQRLSRQISGTLVGLVLGGGAALGMAHVGVIRVLEREKIPVDVVVGSSMGALVGGLWVSGYNADELEKVAREFSRKTGMLKLFDPPIQRGLLLLGISCVLWSLGLVMLAVLFILLLIPLGIVPVSGMVKGRAIDRWLKGKFGLVAFHDTRVPLRVVGYDLLHRREIVFDQGRIVDAVFKSVSIPGIIPPSMEAGQMIIDGGVLNPLPVNVLTEMGIKRIIAVNVLQSSEEVCWGEEWEVKRLRHLSRTPFARHPWKFISLRLGRLLGGLFMPNIADIIVRTLQASEHVFAETSGQQADVLIHPDLRGIQWFELYEVDKLIRRGYDAAMRDLPAMKALLRK